MQPRSNFGEFTEKATKILTELGYREFSNNSKPHARGFQKRLDPGDFEGAVGCVHNSLRLHPTIYIYEWVLDSYSSSSIEIDLTVGLKGGHSLHLLLYSLREPEELLELPKILKGMIAALGAYQKEME